MAPDLEGMKMPGIASMIGVHVAECGFGPFERDDGLHPTGRSRPRCDTCLRERGYVSPPPPAKGKMIVVNEPDWPSASPAFPDTDKPRP
jgi:hypothetical protein